MTTEYIDETKSSRPLTKPDAGDVEEIAARIERITLAMESLEVIAEAFDKDEDWKIISGELGKRLNSIVYGFFKNNPSDPNIKMKYATSWGQFHEILKLTEMQVGVRKEIQQLKKEKKSVMDKLAEIWKKFASKNEEG